MTQVMHGSSSTYTNSQSRFSDLKRKTLLQKYQPPIYQIPNHLSQPLKVVLDYLDNVKRWDFDALRAIHVAFYPTDLARVLALVTPHQE